MGKKNRETKTLKRNLFSNYSIGQIVIIFKPETKLQQLLWELSPPDFYLQFASIVDKRQNKKLEVVSVRK